MQTRRLALGAVLTALALALSVLENAIPIPIPLPGVKLGLANIATVTALYFLGTRQAFAILTVRCLLGSLFGGGVTALAFSLMGGLLAMGIMAVARHIPALSIYGVSLLGAAAHSAGQILAAMALLRSVYVAAYLPWLLAAGTVTGLLTGAAAAGLFRALLATGQCPGALRSDQSTEEHT